MIRRNVTKKKKEVSVQKVIKSPNHIRAGIHEEISSNNLSLSLGIKSPELSEIMLLLQIKKQSIETYKVETRSIADFEKNHETGKTKSTRLIFINIKKMHTMTRAIIVFLKTFSKQLPTPINKMEERASINQEPLKTPTEQTKNNSERNELLVAIQVLSHAGIDIFLHQIKTITPTPRSPGSQLLNLFSRF